MPLTMKEKQAVAKQLTLEYKRARKKKKGEIIDSVIKLTNYNRFYAARVLRQRVRPKVLGRGKVGGVNITLVEDELESRDTYPISYCCSHIEQRDCFTCLFIYAILSIWLEWLVWWFLVFLTTSLNAVCEE